MNNPDLGAYYVKDTHEAENQDYGFHLNPGHTHELLKDFFSFDLAVMIKNNVDPKTELEELRKCLEGNGGGFQVVPVPNRPHEYELNIDLDLVKKNIDAGNELAGFFIYGLAQEISQPAQTIDFSLQAVALGLKKNKYDYVERALRDIGNQYSMLMQPLRTLTELADLISRNRDLNLREVEHIEKSLDSLIKSMAAIKQIQIPVSNETQNVSENLTQLGEVEKIADVLQDLREALAA
jgi:hypothetical protein